MAGGKGRSSQVAREPCESRLSAARGRTLRRHRGFISSAALPAAEKGERRFCRAQLSCCHIRICSQLRPAPGFGEVWGGGSDLPFLQHYFYPAPQGFAAPCLQKLKLQTSWGRLLAGRHRTDSHVAARGFTKHHLAAPTAAEPHTG